MVFLGIWEVRVLLGRYTFGRAVPLDETKLDDGCAAHGMCRASWS